MVFVDNVLEFIPLLLRQFAGGPGPAEDNLVRFGLPAILGGILLYIAWNHQRSQDLPREKLLVWGLGLALLSDLDGAFKSVNQLGIFILPMSQIVFRKPISRSYALHHSSRSAFPIART